MKVHSATATAITASLLLLVATTSEAHEPHTASLPVTPAAVLPASAAQTAEGAVASFHLALGRGDTAAALALLAEDVLIFESGGVERNRAEYAAHHLAADAQFSAAVDRKLVDRRVVEEGNVALVTSIETVTGTFRGRPINSRSLETMTLRRVAGQWRIAHIHWSSADLDEHG
jgi:ketosteroid isomerase-like protein